MRFLRRARPVGHDYVNCTNPSPNYCIERLAAGLGGLDDMCGPCLAFLIPRLDEVAARTLPWADGYRVRAGLRRPPRLKVGNRFAGWRRRS